MFDSLAGKRIAVTRPLEQSESLCQSLKSRGAEPVLLPTIRFAPMADPSVLDKAIERIPEFDWIVFTSVNGVQYFWDQFGEHKLPDSIRLAAVGPATARALSERGFKTDLVPEKYLADDLPRSLGDVSGSRILLPQAAIARESLGDELTELGAHVTRVATYQTLPATADASALAEIRRGVDMITFTSSSTVKYFLEMLSEANIRPATNWKYACIGPRAAETAIRSGLQVAVIATVHTVDGLIEAMDAYYRKSPEFRAGVS